ncbi:DoxX family protein [Tsuneonella sp. YG55]|uniref:DoxX family protein n=1 Tax=Tsuneonella litorea TaxID=2976475 RepID=A0A9X3AMJ3_9SPHN|nr:DoxX family protein [Tsuneonella litorea]MCT2558512.1 DoxX family protein [Tsuneonella litorea]
MTAQGIRAGLRWLLGLCYAAAGSLHLAAPGPFLKIMPGWVPEPDVVVALTGVAELAGAAGLLQGWSRGLRYAAGLALALYAVCVWPANFNHMAMDLARPDGGLGLAYHAPRLAFQPILVWLALWTGEVTRWPLDRAHAK